MHLSLALITALILFVVVLNFRKGIHTLEERLLRREKGPKPATPGIPGEEKKAGVISRAIAWIKKTFGAVTGGGRNWSLFIGGMLAVLLAYFLVRDLKPDWVGVMKAHKAASVAGGFIAVLVLWELAKRKEGKDGGKRGGLLLAGKTVFVWGGVILVLLMIPACVVQVLGPYYLFHKATIPTTEQTSKEARGGFLYDLPAERIITAPPGSTNDPPEKWSELVRRDRWPDDGRGDFDTLSWRVTEGHGQPLAILGDQKNVVVVGVDPRGQVKTYFETLQFVALTTNKMTVRVTWTSP